MNSHLADLDTSKRRKHTEILPCLCFSSIFWTRGAANCLRQSQQPSADGELSFSRDGPHLRVGLQRPHQSCSAWAEVRRY